MNKAVCCAFLVVTLACQKPSAAPSAHPVAMVDLDRVAKAFGRDQQLLKVQQEAEANLGQQLQKLRDDMVAKISEEERKAGPKAAPDEIGRLANLRAESQHNLDAKVQEAQQLAEKHKRELIQQFKDEVRPVIRRVAAQRGIDVVMTADTAYDFSPEVDVTDAVILELRKNEALAPPPAPAQQQQQPAQPPN